MHTLLQAQPRHLPPVSTCVIWSRVHVTPSGVNVHCTLLSPVSASDAQGSFVALGSDPAKHFKHLGVPLGSIAACSLMLCWTAALNVSVQNVVVARWRWGCPANAVCMLFSRIDNINVFLKK